MKRSLITLLLAAAILMMSIVISTGCNTSTHSTTSETQPAVSMNPTTFKEHTQRTAEVRLAHEVKEDDVADADIEKKEVMYYTEEEVVMMAKLLYRECGGVPSDTEKACVAWCVCNRVDSDEFEGDTIADIVTARYQFAYRYNTQVDDEIYDLALDVLSRWNAEKNGEVSVGRVLPKDYTYFHGDGVHNYFRNAYKGSYSVWDYSLISPYKN